MEISVEEFIQVPWMKGSHIIAGGRGKDKMIDSLSMLDGYTGYLYIKENTLAISSCYFLSVEQNKISPFIHNLSERGASGLTLKECYFEKSVLDTIRKIADELNFPIICLNDDNKFYELFDFFYSSIYCYKSNDFLLQKEASSSLVNAMYKGGLDRFARILNCWTGKVVLIMLHDNVFSYPKEKNSMLVAELAKYDSKPNFCSSEEFPGLVSCQSDKAKGLGITFTYKKNREGMIWLEENATPFTSNDSDILTAARIACETGVMQIAAYEQDEVLVKSRFVEDLITGKISTMKDSVPLAQRLSWYIPQTVQVLVIHDKDDPATYQKMENELEEQFRRKENNIIVSPYQQNLVVLLPGDLADPLKLIHGIQETLRKKWVTHQICFALGRTVDFNKIHESYSQACLALKIMPFLEKQTDILMFEDLGIFKLYGIEGMNQEVYTMCFSMLKPLVDFYKTTENDLIGTMMIFFHDRFNYSKTGKSLFVHANTIRYRIELIEKLCGISFENYQDVLNMQFALEFLPFVFPDYPISRKE